MSYPISTLNWPHPAKSLVTREVARSWSPSDCRLTRKYDGEFSVREISGLTLLGEIVRPKSGGLFTLADKILLSEHGEFFAAFDCVGVNGVSIAERPTIDRVHFLKTIDFAFFPTRFMAESVTGIDAVLEAGGEGIVRQEWSAPYGQITVCKRGEIYICQVTAAPGQSQSAQVRILAAESGDRSGIIEGVTTGVRFGGGKADRIAVGSIVRVEGMGLTSVGKIREPKLASDWLIQ